MQICHLAKRVAAKKDNSSLFIALFHQKLKCLADIQNKLFDIKRAQRWEIHLC